MAELALGGAVFGTVARTWTRGRAGAAVGIPILVGVVADRMVRGGPVERHRKVSVARKRLARCDMPPVVVL